MLLSRIWRSDIDIWNLSGVGSPGFGFFLYSRQGGQLCYRRTPLYLSTFMVDRFTAETQRPQRKREDFFQHLFILKTLIPDT